jgi:hypothetical protein
MEYPVLVIKASDDNLYVFFSEEELSFTSVGLLKNGVFDNTNFIDRNLNVFLIKHIERIGWATPFWGYSFLKKGRQIKIKISFQLSNKMSINEVKSIVSSKIFGNYFYDKDFIIEHLEKAKTMEEICQLFV